MRTIPEIHAEIERLSEVRGELWQQLSYGRQQALVDEIKHIDEQLLTLWDEHRAERARIRFGERDDIVRQNGKATRGKRRCDRGLSASFLAKEKNRAPIERNGTRMEADDPA